MILTFFLGFSLIFISEYLKRRERDSNPRTCYSQRFSRPPHSTALPSLQKWKTTSFQWCKCKDIFNTDKFIYRIFTLKSLMFWKSILKIHFISKADFLNTPQKAPMLCSMSNTKPKFHTDHSAKEWCFP